MASRATRESTDRSTDKGDIAARSRAGKSEVFGSMAGILFRRVRESCFGCMIGVKLRRMISLKAEFMPRGRWRSRGGGEEGGATSR